MFFTYRSKKLAKPAWKIAQTHLQVFPTMNEAANNFCQFPFLWRNALLMIWCPRWINLLQPEGPMGRFFQYQAGSGRVLKKKSGTGRVAELDSLSSGAKMAMKIFVKRVFTISPTNASFLWLIANLQTYMQYAICNIYHVIVHFLPQKQCFFGKKCTITWYMLHISLS